VDHLRRQHSRLGGQTVQCDSLGWAGGLLHLPPPPTSPFNQRLPTQKTVLHPRTTRTTNLMDCPLLAGPPSLTALVRSQLLGGHSAAAMRSMGLDLSKPVLDHVCPVCRERLAANRFLGAAPWPLSSALLVSIAPN
jgi:hypothetical protein